ncbi:Oxygen-insensitive NADPH nitroreductase [Labilithrix luteola]|uniref:Oxygen-insensitive NADPH nitroreductase n=2 Tax=Labilithrix luteola TaxID=1391654 RepID=A0A0K1PWP9_9BACT|nr:nitroreductase family protein [Labilithrix luteola]AKU97942.1 Oxygen-insensitive NADPH nitroreductase [Labilithrix luteola]
MFPARWSPRAFLSEAVAPASLDAMFEAARWAPSSYNAQPAPFVYARTETDLERFLTLFVPRNRRWAAAAPVLVVCVARSHFADGRPNPHASFDAGAAVMSFCLQGQLLGVATHVVAAINHEAAYDLLRVPAHSYQALCAIAVGRRGERHILPADLQALEHPSPRRPLERVAFEGTWPPHSVDHSD